MAQAVTRGDLDLSIVAAGRARRHGDRVHVTGALRPPTSRLVLVLDGRAHVVDVAEVRDADPGGALEPSALCALGAIGFTFEHEHRGYLRRTLTLDALHGSVDELTIELGTAARRDGLGLAAVL